MKLSSNAIRILIAVLAAALVVLAVYAGLLDAADGVVSDLIFQRGPGTDGEIVVIGIDARATDALGPFPWSRDVLADAIRRLNSDPEAKPAVIGVDVLFVGGSADPRADEYLAETCAEGGNVVVASSAIFGTALVRDGDRFYEDTRAILEMDVPYPALAAVTDSGHVNAVYDSDSVIRHQLYALDTPAGRVKSFARVIYERWCREKGFAPSRDPSLSDDGFFYLGYTAAPGGYYDGVSVLDLVEGTVEPDYFAGKIVLIGPYSSGLTDSYITAIDHTAPMYGVEIQANQIDAYRSGFVPRDAPRWAQLVLLFIVAALALYVFFDRDLMSLTLIWLAGSAVWLALALGLYRLGFVVHALWIPAALTLIYIISVAVNYARAQEERSRVTATFGRYVDPAILSELLDKGGEALELGGRTHDIAVLFADIRNFTTLSESLDPPTVVEIVNSYLALTTECVMRYHGTLDKFVGDCTMAFWNAPVEQEDPVYLAACAAMDMVEGSRALGDELMARYGRTVSFGVGINYGPAVVGNIGAPMRMDYTAIGDTVNTAARLESNAPGGKILISRVVADALGDRAETTSLGETIRLKGKAEGFEVLTLDRLKKERRK